MKKRRGPVVLAVGFFDGLHKGHQKVIERAISEAKDISGRTWVLTFNTHPMKVLDPESAPPLLTSSRHKLKLLNRLCIDGCLLLSFTRKFAKLGPESFISRLCTSIPTLHEIVAGRNWRFGRDGKGDAILLSRMAQELNVKVDLVRPVLRRGRPVSSTRIRDEILRGKFEEAAAMLGRPFSILGTVFKGRTMGRKLGFPTANLDSHNETLPPCGIYAVHLLIKNKAFDGVLNLGTRPTFNKQSKEELSLELHVLDFQDSLYGKDLEVFFVRKIRNERAFPSATSLKKQISLDVAHARALLARKKLKESLYMPA